MAVRQWSFESSGGMTPLAQPPIPPMRMDEGIFAATGLIVPKKKRLLYDPRDDGMDLPFGGGGGGAVWRGNEPAGMTTVHDTAFNAEPQTGWFEFGDVGIASDAAAPQSPPSVREYTFSTGFTGGGSPGSMESNNGNGNFNFHEMYFCTAVKYSSNWWSHSSGVNKQFHGWTDNGNKMVITAFGKDANGSTPDQGDMFPVITFQGIVAGGNQNGTAGRYPLDLTQPGLAPYVRGQWHQLEVHAVKNTNGNADADVRLWFDGVLRAHATGIQITSTNSVWERFQISAIWGGTGNTVPSPGQTLRIDHMYLSGKGP